MAKSTPDIFPTSEIAFFCDEVGRGAWAHDLVACAVYIDPRSAAFLIDSGVKDSKRFSDTKNTSAHQKRQVVADAIMGHVDFAIGRATPKEIDESNILDANFLAIRRAVAALEEQLGVQPQRVIVDGSLRVRGLDRPQILIPKGDLKFVQIAAASIIAKVLRDCEMQSLHERYPWYGWDTNKGYGGVDKNGYSRHREGLRTRGAVPGVHRYSLGDIGLFPQYRESKLGVAV